MKQTDYPSFRVGVVNSRAETLPVHVPRALLDHEQEYRNIVSTLERPLFKTHILPDLDEPIYRTQVAWIVDSLDLLETRPDMSFDSIWKPFETELKKNYGSKVTPGLLELSKDLDPVLTNSIWMTAPERSFEYIFNRLNPRELSGREKEWSKKDQIQGQLIQKYRVEWQGLKEVLLEKYPVSDAETNRNAARFLRKVLRGERPQVDGEVIEIDQGFGAAILLNVLLYALRNDRMHGSSMPPLLSSRATIKTYPVQLHCFASTYSLLHSLWISNKVIPGLDNVRVATLLEENTDGFRKLLKNVW